VHSPYHAIVSFDVLPSRLSGGTTVVSFLVALRNEKNFFGFGLSSGAMMYDI
jgi:hypothetical protein